VPRYNALASSTETRRTRDEDVMAYDLVIRNGMIPDGSGFTRYRADIGIAGDTIVDIRQVRGAAAP
jgi:N-acyl-D-aspartate/D-glutamate deacylase